jgi:phosphatidylserine/phosphatidylglycerophosphate/cardiolipin synthase-like enzyme
MKLFPLVNSIFYRELIKQNIEIYEYLPNILHAKILMIDNWAIVGSSNLNNRSQKHDWEIDYSLQLKSNLSNLKNRLELYSREVQALVNNKGQLHYYQPYGSCQRDRGNYFRSSYQHAASTAPYAKPSSGAGGNMDPNTWYKLDTPGNW